MADSAASLQVPAFTDILLLKRNRRIQGLGPTTLQRQKSSKRNVVVYW